MKARGRIELNTSSWRVSVLEPVPMVKLLLSILACVLVLSACGTAAANRATPGTSHKAAATAAPRPTPRPVAVAPSCASSVQKNYSDVFHVNARYVYASDGLATATLVSGCGPAVATGDVITVQYSEWLVDGSLFASSRAAGHQPLVFQVGSGSVIPGLDQGVLGMQIGTVRRLVLPPALAFGSAGAAGIPPGSKLVFNVELLSIARYPSQPHA